MNKIKVTLKHITPFDIAVQSIRTCWDSNDKSDGGAKDRELVHRVTCKFKHGSQLEHIVAHFHIEGVSRALLQEFARHRMASLSVKSTRYTLGKDLKNEEPFLVILNESDNDEEILKHFTGEMTFHQDVFLFGKYRAIAIDNQRALKYIVKPENSSVWIDQVMQLEKLREVVVENNGKNNDVVKYLLPECYRLELHQSINFRSLQNLLQLRTDKSALREFQIVATRMYEAIPDEYKYLLDEFVK